MRYELEGIDILVNKQLLPDKLIQCPPNDGQLQKWLLYLEDEKTKVCRAFLTEIYDLNLSERAQLYIQLHQASLATMVDTLQEYIRVAKNKQLKEFYLKICALIDSIAAYMQEYLNKYIDHDLPVPHSYNRLLQEKMDVAITQLLKRYKETEVEASLLYIIQHPIKSFLETPQKINFRKALYFQEVMVEIVALPQLYAGIDLVKRLHELLHSFNYNAPEYIHYCMTTLEAKLKNQANNQKRIELLEWYIKNINQLPIKTNCVLIPNLPSVCEQMLIWINEEYKYLLSSQHNISISNNSRTEQCLKIKTSFSVSQLAVFARVLIAKGVIINETNIEVLRFLAQYVATPNVDQISEESLKNKFYNIEPGTIGQMKEWLSGLDQALDGL